MTDSVNVQRTRLRPLLTPNELREATIRDYRLAADRAGVAVDTAALERQVVEDCELGGRVRAEAAANPAPARTPAPARMDIDEEAAKVGGEFIAPSQVQYRPIAGMHAKSGTERWMRAKARVRRIIAGATPNTDPLVAYSTCEIPRLAFEIYRIQANLTVRKRMPRPGDEPNPFFGLSDIPDQYGISDVDRLLQRQIEDVCDLSTGRLGTWFTAK